MAEPSTAVPSSAAGPFAGIRVLELTRGIAGRTAGMLLADFGADVIRATDDRPATERDPGGLCWDRGKVLAPLHGTSTRELRRLAAAADVLLTDQRPAEIADHWASQEAALAASPRLVHAWLPPYAARGAWRDLPDDPLLLAAVGGFAAHFPAVADVPVAPVVPVVSYIHGAVAAAAVAAALVGRGADGPGRRVVVSGLHAIAATQASMMMTAEDGTALLSAGKRTPGAPNYRSYRGSDGRWLYLAALTPGFFFRALEVLDRMDILVRDDMAGEFMNLLRPDVGAAVGAELAETFATRPSAAWLRLLADAGIPAAPVGTREEWLAGEPVAAIGARLEVGHPGLGRVVMPGVAVTLPATPGRVRHLPSAEHVAAASSLWPAAGGAPALPAAGRTQGGPAPADLPLAGIRVLDMSTFMAAPFAGTLLADFGADVVKVEPAGGDPYRVYSASYTAVNQRKRAAALDLREPDERGALLRLAAGADVLIDNLRADSLCRLGLGDGVLAAAFPRLVRCSVSAYGRTGPFADLPGFDPVMQARSGMMIAQGGAGDPVASVAPVHDVGTAALATLGILAALFARTRTGLGQHVTTSLAASSLFLQSGELTTFAGRKAAQAGGVDFPGPSAVRRYYQASDGWLAIAATTPAHVAELLSAVGHPEWGALANETRANETRGDDDALADRLFGVLAQRPVRAWVAELAARQVPACPVLPRAGELADPFLVENEFSHLVADPVAGKLRVARASPTGQAPARRRRGRPAGQRSARIPRRHSPRWASA
jgi:crotonobetainyl-CoA:carnitine CoA-transferase CaiB-like acyl-CoA transferase